MLKKKVKEGKKKKKERKNKLDENEFLRLKRESERSSVCTSEVVKQSRSWPNDPVELLRIKVSLKKHLLP